MKKLIIILTATMLAGFAFAVKPAAYSDQITTLRAGDILAETQAGTAKVKYFSYTTAALSNQTVALVEIPANARILGGAIQSTDMTGSEVLSLGLIGADGSGYINGTSTADNVSLFLSSVANPQNHGFGLSGSVAAIASSNTTYAAFDKNVYLAVTCPAGVPWVADKVISGWIMYAK